MRGCQPASGPDSVEVRAGEVARCTYTDGITGTQRVGQINRLTEMLI